MLKIYFGAVNTVSLVVSDHPQDVTVVIVRSELLGTGFKSV
jgi:hypothetical protein